MNHGEATGGGARTRPHELFEVSGLVLRLAEVAVVALVGMTLAAVLERPLQLGSTGHYHRATFLGALCFGLLAELTGGYESDARFSLRNAWSRVATAWLATCIALIAVGFFLKSSADYSRAWTGLWFVITFGALGIARGIGVAMSRRIKRRGLFDQRIAIFGDAAQAQRLADYIAGDARLTIETVAYFEDRAPGERADVAARLPYGGDLAALRRRIRAGGIDQVIIVLPGMAEARIKQIVADLSMLPVLIRLAPDLSNFAFSGRSIVVLGDLPLMTLFERPISGLDHVLKRAEDLLLGSLAMILAAPVMAAAMLAIRLEGPGPLFFRQRREGFNGDHFLIWKLRSMRVETAQPDAIDQARRGDPRVTRVGRFLRRSSIDELPQLLNVLRGDMSLVGPRPHAPSTRLGDRVFSEAMENYAARHRVKPGMTGWAQVNGWRGETDTDEKLARRVEHDLFYIENWSLGFDLYVLARTIVSVLFPRAGAF